MIWRAARQFLTSAFAKVGIKVDSNDMYAIAAQVASTPGFGFDTGGQVYRSRIEYASLLSRFVAAILDGLITGITVFVLVIGAAIADKATGGNPADAAGTGTGLIVALASFAMLWLYNVAQETSGAQATLGKRLMGIKVASLNGEPIGVARSTIRFLVKVVPGANPLLGAFSLLADIVCLTLNFSQGRTAHDIIAAPSLSKTDGKTVFPAFCKAPRADMIRGMPENDCLQILLHHDRWATAQMLSGCGKLNADQFQQRFEIGPGSLHDTLTHMIAAMRTWTDTLIQRDLRPRLEFDGQRRTPEQLLALHEQACDELSAEAIRRPMAEVVTRLLRDGSSIELTRGEGLCQILTHGTHHRAQCLNMLRQIGIKPLPPSSVMEWTRLGKTLA